MKRELINKLLMATHDLTTMQQRNQMRALTAYLKNPQLAETLTMLDEELFSISEANKNKRQWMSSNAKLLAHFSDSDNYFDSDVLIRFYTALINAKKTVLDYLTSPRCEKMSAEEKNNLTKLCYTDRLDQRKMQMALFNQLDRKQEVPAHNITFPSSISHDALPVPGEFDEDDFLSKTINGVKREFTEVKISEAELQSKRDAKAAQSRRIRLRVAPMQRADHKKQETTQEQLSHLFKRIQSLDPESELKEELIHFFSEKQHAQLLQEKMTADTDAKLDHRVKGNTLLTFCIMLDNPRSRKIAEWLVDLCMPDKLEDREAAMNQVSDEKFYQGCNALALAIIYKNKKLARQLLARGGVPIYSEERKSEYMDGYLWLLNQRGVTHAERNNFFKLQPLNVKRRERNEGKADLAKQDELHPRKKARMV